MTVVNRLGTLNLRGLTRALQSLFITTHCTSPAKEKSVAFTAYHLLLGFLILHFQEFLPTKSIANRSSFSTVCPITSHGQTYWSYGFTDGFERCVVAPLLNIAGKVHCFVYVVFCHILPLRSSHRSYILTWVGCSMYPYGPTYLYSETVEVELWRNMRHNMQLDGWCFWLSSFTMLVNDVLF
ncbi:hypothetical protein RHMOL_Rhmol01G0357700 [Rhododendron molle]|uniref:Uncharacterized protein n=1 Tax=Rhododendron molle TaxID=49168 RepID=A0ACC0QAV2_RHOML|nr:hypothetical protein RHMOL_Rhmol01G0357700 [Rhododendron molle]